MCSLRNKKKGKGYLWYEEYILFYSGKEKNERATSGVGLLIHEKHENKILDTKYISDRMLQLTLKLQGNTLTHIYSVYAPDIIKSQKKKEDFYDLMQAYIDNIPKKDETVILGDFNAGIGNKVINGIKNRLNEDILNDNGDMMISFCSMNELRINNTFYPHKPQHKYTFENTMGQKSTLD